MKLIFYRHNHHGTPPSVKSAPISFCDLTLVLKGELLYRIDEREYRIQEGDGIFITANSLRERLDSQASPNYVSFNFITDAPPVFPVKLPQILNNEIKLLIACADEIEQKYFPDGDIQIEKLLECLLYNIRSNLESTKEHPLVTKIKRYVKDHLSEKITLQKISEETYFSPFYCETVFKQQTGYSIIAYVIEYRVEEAQKLLLEGSLALKTIAEAVGFEDYNYFARTFKKITGRTPREYRNSLQ